MAYHLPAVPVHLHPPHRLHQTQRTCLSCAWCCQALLLLPLLVCQTQLRRPQWPQSQSQQQQASPLLLLLLVAACPAAASPAAALYHRLHLSQEAGVPLLLS
jgi:hypothetical protein